MNETGIFYFFIGGLVDPHIQTVIRLRLDFAVKLLGTVELELETLRCIFNALFMGV